MARNLKLIDAGDVDATDLRSLVATATKGCKTDREKMVALWAYIAHRPYYHWCEARENPEGTTELGVVFDPIAAFNVHGTTICYQVADVLANLGDAGGIKTRTRSVPGHKVMEAFYDGAWHLFDAQYDLQSYFVADDGKTIISLAELCKDAGKYIRKPKHPSDPFFQFDKYGGKFWPWESKEYVIKKFYHPGVPANSEAYVPYLARGHTIHLDLRRGETLVRRFEPAGKWFCPENFYDHWRRDLTQKWVPKGPHDPRNPEHTYVNGELIYEPDWAAHENNFTDGLWEGKGYVLKDGRVHPAGRGDCVVVFRVQTPYLVAGDPGRLDTDGDSTDGAVFEAEFLRKTWGAHNAVAVSTDNGRTWTEVWRNGNRGKPRTVRLDLTDLVEGTYGYLVKVTLRASSPDHAALGKLRMRTSLFLSPVPLPRIKPGRNRFRFSLEPGHGVMRIVPDLGSRETCERDFHELQDLTYNSNYVRHLQPVKEDGHAVLEVAPPRGTRVERLSVHLSLGLQPGSGDREAAEVLWATRPRGKWTSVWKSDFSRRNQKWRWDETVEFALPEPAEKGYLKVRLRRRRWMSLNMIRVYAHTRRTSPTLPPGSIVVKHEWTEDGAAKSRTVRPDLDGQTYTVNAKGKKITNKAVTLMVRNEK
ncbi:MAG: hypothetical protein R6V58_00440 [Planctomycetota bacterium]